MAELMMLVAVCYQFFEKFEKMKKKWIFSTFFNFSEAEKNWKKVDEAATATEVETKDEKTCFKNELCYLVTRRSISSTTMCVKKKWFYDFSTFFNFF